MTPSLNTSKELLSSLRCPECGARMKSRKVMDPYVRGLICENAHRYFQTLQIEDTKLVDPAPKLDPQYQRSRNDAEMIKHWLTNERCRSHVLNNVATMLRRIYEITKKNDPRKKRPVTTAARLAPSRSARIQSSGGWSNERGCKNGH